MERMQLHGWPLLELGYASRTYPRDIEVKEQRIVQYLSLARKAIIN